MNYNNKYFTLLEKLKAAIAPILILFFLSTTTIFAQDTTPNDSQMTIDKDNQRKFDFYFYDALSAKAQGKFDEAFDLFQHCLQFDSTNANVLQQSIWAKQ